MLRVSSCGFGMGPSLTTAADGRIDIKLSTSLTKTLIRLVPGEKDGQRSEPRRSSKADPSLSLRLNIVIQVVGSRGDVQPFVALGQELQTYGHRVRLATHDIFEHFVSESGLEFFPIGGDPKELMAYMVKNPGLIPSMKSLREGDIKRKREMIAQMLRGCWRSCIDPDPKSQRHFVADAIIANPPSFAHIHCAQALGIPVHLMFTMPWSSTRIFPHPLANFIGNVDINPALINYASYGIVEFLTWQGLGDVINDFRKSLDLEAIPKSVGPVLAQTLKIPFTYCWSPALVPKPYDWGSHIDVCGYFFREAPKYDPPSKIDHFLQDRPPPVYFGFGSIVVEDSVSVTSIILDAVHSLGVRAIISRGWSHLGAGIVADDSDVLFIDDCPHEWLFQHVAAVVHHGGAGTVACGLRNGCPTTVIPFFGDQPFWGDMIAAAGAGPEPIHHKSLTAQNLADAISFCLTPEAHAAAKAIASQMVCESGVSNAVHSFHANLPLEVMQCSLLPDHVASWTHKNTKARLSKLAAQLLIENGIILPSELANHETESIVIVNNRWDPITSTGSASAGVVGDLGNAAVSMLYDPLKELKRSDAEGAGKALVAGRIATSTAKGFGNFNLALFKGLIVDLPLATAEGFRNVPKMYGEEVRSHGEVTGVTSGFQVGMRNFSHGIVDGFTDPFKQPYEHAKTEGAVGFAKGLGLGMVGLVSKTSSALVGAVAYPGDGICKSIRYATHRTTRKDIRARKLMEGSDMARRNEVNIDVLHIIATFRGLITTEGAGVPK